MRELGPEARSLLDAAQGGDDPAPADRARLKRSLLSAVAVGGALGATSAAEAASGSAALGASHLGLGVKLFVAALAIGAAVGGGALVSTTQRAAPSSPPAPVASVTAGSPSSSLVVPQATKSPPVSHEDPPAPSVSAAPPKPSARAAARPAPSEPEEEDELEEETRKLRAVHGALQGGDPGKALALLDEQAPDQGQLGEEREVARVLALCKLGRDAEAAAAAASFLRAHPASPLGDRVRGGCDRRSSP